MDTPAQPTAPHPPPRHYPLSRRSVRLANLTLWLFGLLAAVSVFSLAREALGPSWPLGRAVAHSAVLAVSVGLCYAAALVLHRHRAALSSPVAKLPTPADEHAQGRPPHGPPGASLGAHGWLRC
ncbi:hypothetical protein EDD99_6615 [Streptomyces sp. 846.5]|nr:hypothetical protein EDD99_6615 [Streptomyces sp. 846.5]